MPVAGGGSEQRYNAQAALDTDNLLAIATGLTRAANDKQQLTPVLTTLDALPEDLGEVTHMPVGADYYNACKVTACIHVGIEPLRTSGRGHISKRFCPAEPSQDLRTDQ